MTTKQAVALTTAEQKELHKEAYLKPVRLSSLKLLIGGLLLFGNKEQMVFWPFFEATLRQYIDLTTATQSGLEQPGQANRGQTD